MGRAAISLVAVLLPLIFPSSGPPLGRDAAVIIQADSLPAAAAAVKGAGGIVTATLPIVDGVAARVPASALDRVVGATGVRAVTPNLAVTMEQTTPSDGAGFPSVFNQEIDARRLHREGTTGTGVRVAVIDTGVSPVRDLIGRVARVPDPSRGTGEVECINFSGEETCTDSYGHGTFVAGLIAGTGASSNGTHTGVAPGAEIVSIKIAGRDGSADVSKVLAAIQWVVSFARPLGIRVLNLSLGTDSTVSARIDPLNHAVQRAWKAGIAVVVSASNRGPGARTISKPADDPLVITVGAVDDRGTPDIDDDPIPDFSARGPTAADGVAKPDVVAPGARVVSLQAPGSYVEANAPPPGDPTYRRGSGTSMSAAIVSGAAALAFQEHPDWSPDYLKYALVQTARGVASRDQMAVGAGMVTAFAASRRPPAGPVAAKPQFSDASGRLSQSRASVKVDNVCPSDSDGSGPQCDVVDGDETARGRSFDAAEYRSSAWDGSSWYSSQWARLDGSSWYGSSWYGSSWYGSSWYGSSWYGAGDGTGYGVSMAGSSWYGAW